MAIEDFDQVTIAPAKLRPFSKFIMSIGELPTSYLDSLSYAEQVTWFCDYLQNNVIPALNNNAQALQEVQNLMTELQTYVSDYFDNLDVQEEINNKLDDMVNSGELQSLLDLQYNNLRNEVNEDIDEIRTVVNNVASGSPLVAASTSDMTDTSRIYVNTSDGKWYYYNGTNWTIGGIYQASKISNNSIDLLMLDSLLQSNFNPIYSTPLDLGNAYSGYYKTDGTLATSDSFINYHYSLENGKIYTFNGENNYQCCGLVIKDSSDNLIYQSNPDTTARATFTTTFKCEQNNLTAYISYQNNYADTDIRYYNTILREMIDLYNSLKYSDNIPVIKTIGAFNRADKAAQNKIEFVSGANYSTKMYQMNKGQTYKINYWNYANICDLIVAKNDNTIIYASSTSNIGDSHVNGDYEFTATDDGYILLCTYTASGQLYTPSISIINNNINIVANNILNGKKISFNGDSICAGAGYNGGYGLIIANKNNMIYENIARGGATITSETYTESSTARHWINATVTDMAVDSDYAIVEGGVNDSSLNVTLGTISNGYDTELDTSTYYGAFENMLKQLVSRFKGKKYGYIAVHQMTANYRVINDPATSYYWAARKCCEKWGVPFLDLNVNVPPFAFMRNTSLSSLPETYTKDGDGWHPNELGYKKYYVDKIEDWLKSL